jgi:hypothetical protein
MSVFNNQDYAEASELWLKEFKKQHKYHFLKNHIICELLFYENQKKFKQYSFTDTPSVIVIGLYEIINSEKFRKEFTEIFNIHNDTPIRDDMILSLKHELPQFLAETFFDLSEDL